jgi:hypothetical protein
VALNTINLDQKSLNHTKKKISPLPIFPIEDVATGY